MAAQLGRLVLPGLLATVDSMELLESVGDLEPMGWRSWPRSTFPVAVSSVPQDPPALLASRATQDQREGQKTWGAAVLQEGTATMDGLEKTALLEHQERLETVEEMVCRGRVESSTLPERLELLASQARLDPWAELAILEEREDLVSNLFILK